MGRKANCYDNAMMESFGSTLKAECFASYLPATHREARQVIFAYIETYYNRVRLHNSLGYQSPVDFEQQLSQPINVLVLRPSKWGGAHSL